jgi:hypothetical protein
MRSVFEQQEHIRAAVSRIHGTQAPLPTVTKLQSRYGLEKKPESIGQILAHKASMMKRSFVDMQKG